MGKKSPPPAPDFTAAAQLQADSSRQNTTDQTYANRPNISTPWGSQTWNNSQATDPATGKPTTSWSTDIQLTPDQQQALSSQMRVQQGRSGAAENLLGQASGAFQTPMDWGSLPQRAAPVSADGQMGGQVQAGPLTQSVQAQNLQRGVPNPTQGTQSTLNPGDLQTSLNGNPADYRQRAQDAVTELQRPDLEHSRQMLDTQLSNQGITPGSEAYNEAMRHQGDTETRAHLAAIESGRQESQLAFGQDLQAGQFHNASQGQNFGQQATGAQLANSVNAQQFQQGLAKGQFNNDAAQATFQEMLSGGQFANQAEAQQFQQDMSAAQRGDQQAIQRMSMKLQAGNFNNANRQQAIGEGQLQRSQPLNELNALLTGQQVQNPQMPSFTNATKSDTTQFLPAAQAQYGAGLDAFNASQAASASNMGGLFSLGSAAMGSPTGWQGLFNFSDARLKKDIEQVGVLPNGIKIYKFRFIGKDTMELGVMAQEVQEVMPEAVHADDHGWLRVNYNMVLA